MTPPAVVFLTENVATPPPFVVAVAGVIVDEPAPWVSETDWPETRFPNASLAVTVTVDVVAPSAITDAGAAETVDWPASTAATLMLNVELVTPASPADEAASV